MGIPPFIIRSDIMTYLQSYLLDRINQIRQYIKLQLMEQEKCRSKKEWIHIEYDIRAHRAMLDEITTIYELFMKE